MAKVDINLFRKALVKQNSNSLANLAYGALRNKLAAAKSDLIEEFENDEVSQEIVAGSKNPDAPNTTNTLGGKGNLFSFIGFNEGEDPVGEVVQTLKNDIQLGPKPSVIREANEGLFFEFNISIPTIREIDEKHPMPEWSNLGWITAIKRGISGFRSFMYWIRGNSASRSGGGLQAKNQEGEPKILRGGKYNPVTYYLQDMLENFKKALRK